MLNRDRFFRGFILLGAFFHHTGERSSWLHFGFYPTIFLFWQWFPIERSFDVEVTIFHHSIITEKFQEDWISKQWKIILHSCLKKWKRIYQVSSTVCTQFQHCVLDKTKVDKGERGQIFGSNIRNDLKRINFLKVLATTRQTCI